ncbi:MAG TPA: tetratricopeptide repeat protein [Rhizomicrobium sp.]|nr:tetratricopeptide repeat protein [Rhizomicrobium sp.]
MLGFILELIGTPFGWITLGLMVLAIVHAVRGGNFLWVYVIIFLPGLGFIIYIAVEIVYPWLSGGAGVRARKAATAVLDPNRDYRQALRDADMVGSVDAKRALAEQYIQRGQVGQGIALYEEMLKQPIFRDDPVILLGLARARMQLGDGAGAQAALDTLQAADPKYQSEEAHMIYARALEQQGKDEEALTEYRGLARYAGGEEARARLGQLLEKMGRRDEAHEVYNQVVKNITNGQRHYRSAQKEWADIARAGLKR